MSEQKKTGLQMNFLISLELYSILELASVAGWVTPMVFCVVFSIKRQDAAQGLRSLVMISLVENIQM